MAAFYFMRPFIVLVYTFVEHDVEAWACGINESTEKALCRELRAARYLLVPMLVLGVAFLSLVVWQRLGFWRRASNQDIDTVGEAGAHSVEGKV